VTQGIEFPFKDIAQPVGLWPPNVITHSN